MYSKSIDNLLLSAATLLLRSSLPFPTAALPILPCFYSKPTWLSDYVGIKIQNLALPSSYADLPSCTSFADQVTDHQCRIYYTMPYATVLPRVKVSVFRVLAVVTLYRSRPWEWKFGKFLGPCREGENKGEVLLCKPVSVAWYLHPRCGERSTYPQSAEQPSSGILIHP